ncbi:MAG TPA: hypothetical protein VNA20_06425 [Frankiaceae bacterium]|nr:hypothetical protein [Frankiaceae bacterium]
MRLPVRRVLLGLAVGATAGWVAGLLRKPASGPPGSSVDEATRLPQEEFGSPAGEEPTPRPAAEPEPAAEPTAETPAAEAGLGTAADIAQEPTAPVEAFPEPAADGAKPPPRKATPRAVKRPPGSRRTKAAAAEAQPGGSEPAAGPEATATGGDPASTPPPAKPRRPAKAKAKPEPTVVDDAAAALREGHAAATERLSGAEADATPAPPTDAGPAGRRRRRTGGT